MANTAGSRKRRWWAALLLVTIGCLIVARNRSRDADVAKWIEEANARSLFVAHHDEPIFPMLRDLPVIGKVLSRPGIAVIAVASSDLTPLAKMRPCPVNVVFAHSGPITPDERKQLEFQFADALRKQESPGH